MDENFRITRKNDRRGTDQEKKKTRAKWYEIFLKADSKNDHDILIPDIFQDESFDEWRW